MTDTLGRRVRAARLAAGMSQASLARGIMSTSHLSLVERDLRRPSVPALAALAQRLHVPVAALAWSTADTGRIAPECRITQAWRVLQQGQPAAAERLAARVIGDRPDAERLQHAHEARAAARLAQGRHNAAIEDFEAAKRIAQRRRDTRSFVALSMDVARLRRDFDDAA